ncbi:hypothetical protein EV426DRAFT_709404 [Tirmania nivea]|nr:hypothetical protein EV426DRAFT_709404 [Tirmania nivea]
MDTEMLGVVRVWQSGRTAVALDSQGAIGRLRNLLFDQPRSWIEEEAAVEMEKDGRTVIEPLWQRLTPMPADIDSNIPYIERALIQTYANSDILSGRHMC